MKLNNNRNKGHKNIIGSVIAASLLMFGAAACSPDTNSETNIVDNGVVNEDYDTSPVANRDVNAFTAWDYNSDNMWDNDEFTTGMRETGLYDDWDMDNDNLLSENEYNEGIYNTWDRDRDGFINEEEYGLANAGWEDDYGDNFNTWDINNDNMLDNNEFTSGLGDTGIYDRWDMDFDGTMTDDEFYTGAFNSWDNDRDGYLGNDEFDDMGFDNWGL